ncbi:hypothetical protein, partial [Klebsiella michiganensis]
FMSRDAGIDLFFANLWLGKAFTWSHPKFYQLINLNTDKYKTLSSHRIEHLYLRNIDLAKIATVFYRTVVHLPCCHFVSNSH